MILRLCLVAVVVTVAYATIYFDEKFSKENCLEGWEKCKKKDDYGEFTCSAGQAYGDKEKNRGIKTSQNAKFYCIIKQFDKPFTNTEKPLVIQFTVKHEQNIDCGGGYVKIVSSDTDLSDFHADTPYQIMFGPDICGYGTKKVHVILTKDGVNYQNKKDIRCKDDELSHVYTLIIRPDNTYEVKIDNEKVESGSLEDDYEIVKPKKIKDPSAKKPEDWVDKEYIDDADDKKPSDWDQPEHIPDPDAKKPEDWDDEMDGEWEPPKITNPSYKGEWKPRQIKNPAYKGEWVHPEIDNPEYKPNPKLYQFENMNAIGFDLWQVKAGTIFDDLLVTDSVSEAETHVEETWAQTKDAEKKMKESLDEEKRKKEEEEEKERKANEDSEKTDKKEDEDADDDLEEKKDKEEKDEL